MAKKANPPFWTRITVLGAAILVVGFAYTAFFGGKAEQFTDEERRMGLHCLDAETGYHTSFISDLEARLEGQPSITPQTHDVTAEQAGNHEITMFFETFDLNGQAKIGIAVATFRNDDCSHTLQLVRV